MRLQNNTHYNYLIQIQSLKVNNFKEIIENFPIKLKYVQFQKER